jgi:hypothetical protein
LSAAAVEFLDKKQSGFHCPKPRETIKPNISLLKEYKAKGMIGQ